MQEFINNNNILVDNNNNNVVDNMDFVYINQLSQANNKRKLDNFLYDPVTIQLRKPIINTKRSKSL